MIMLVCLHSHWLALAMGQQQDQEVLQIFQRLEISKGIGQRCTQEPRYLLSKLKPGGDPKHGDHYYWRSGCQIYRHLIGQLPWHRWTSGYLPSRWLLLSSPNQEN